MNSSHSHWADEYGNRDVPPVIAAEVMRHHHDSYLNRLEIVIRNHRDFHMRDLPVGSLVRLVPYVMPQKLAQARVRIVERHRDRNHFWVYPVKTPNYMGEPDSRDIPFCDTDGNRGKPFKIRPDDIAVVLWQPDEKEA